MAMAGPGAAAAQMQGIMPGMMPPGMGQQAQIGQMGQMGQQMVMGGGMGQMAPRPGEFGAGRAGEAGSTLGLTLVHFSAQLKLFVSTIRVYVSVCVEPKSECVCVFKDLLA
jgi:hypothetical protein